MNDDTSKEVASQEHSPATSWVRDAAWDARRFGRGIWAAIFCGFLIGGVGGRLAMFVLRLTSDPSLIGRLTDDGFEIGSFTGNTFFLVALCTAAGLLGGLFYLVIRGWLPERGRPLMMAAFGGAVGGSVVIHPGGIDFTQLDPLALAIVMFIALPALYGAAMSRLVDLWIARANQAQRPEHAGALGAVVAFAPLLGLAIIGPIGLATVVLLLAGWFMNRRGVPIERLWHSRAVTLIGRAAMAGVAGLAAFVLAQDITRIL